MKRTIFASAAAALVAGSLCLPACGPAEDRVLTDAAGAVAATLGTEVVYESDVTAYVNSLRASYGAEDDQYWALFLYFNGLTPETLRESIIGNMVLPDVVLAAAADKGVTIPAAELKDAVEKMKTSYGLTDDEWAQVLAQSGMTPESYAAAVEESLLEEALYAKVTADEAITPAVFQQYGMDIVKDRFSHIKASKHILFASDDEETAAAVLAQLQAGEITFDEAVAQYSIDTGSAVHGGEVGWSGVHTFVEPYQNGLDALAVGEMSGLVQSEFGFHIILCTDEFVYAPGMTTEDLPADLVSHVTANYVKSAVWSDFIEKFRASMGFVINEMPEGLDYDIDIEKLLFGDAEGDDADDQGVDGGEIDGGADSADSADSADADGDAATDAATDAAA